ncbi:MAG: hypothetical protein FWC42_10225 [Proteobacteria bacterium]|nr:hypothetical protein [Pseudomonadota bacterium]
MVKNALKCLLTYAAKGKVLNYPHDPGRAIMEKLQLKSLKPRHAILSGDPECVSIEILITPFLWNQEIVNTSIRLDGIDLPSNMLRDLVGKSFEFPINPMDGYIDGSICIGEHHPVDVTSLSFNRSRDGDVSLVVKGVYELDPSFDFFEQTGRIPFTMGTTVSSCAV